MHTVNEQHSWIHNTQLPELLQNNLKWVICLHIQTALTQITAPQMNQKKPLKCGIYYKYSTQGSNPKAFIKYIKLQSNRKTLLHSTRMQPIPLMFTPFLSTQDSTHLLRSLETAQVLYMFLYFVCYCNNIELQQQQKQYIYIWASDEQLRATQKKSLDKHFHHDKIRSN